MQLIPVVGLSLLALSCGSSAGGGDVSTADASVPGSDSGTGSDSAPTADSGPPQPMKDAAPGGDASHPPDSGPPKDAGPPGMLSCTTPGNFAQNWSSSCGTLRWDVKTGTDSAATGVSLLPTLATIASLATIPSPNPFPYPRTPPTETQVYEIRDVTLTFARLETDSDYHIVLTDGKTMMITEIPYPASPQCVNGGAWSCLISRARASVEAGLGLSQLQLNMGHNHNNTVSVVGVGFWDQEHGQYGTSANNLELHPLLGICFGQGCDPTK